MKTEILLKSVLILGITILGSIAFCSLVSIVVYRWYDIHILEGVFQRLIGFDQKQTFSTWYSSSVLLFCAGIIWLISQTEQQQYSRYSKHWMVLIYVFIFLSLDKTVGLHHAIQHDLLYRLPKPVRFDEPVLHGIELTMAASFALNYMRPFLSLPSTTKYILGTAISFYLIAPAIADVLIDARLAHETVISPISNLAELLEETLEMLGVLLFMYGFLNYLFNRQKTIHILIANK